MWHYDPTFLFQAEDGIRAADVTGVQTCALPIYRLAHLAEVLGERRAPLAHAERVEPHEHLAVGVRPGADADRSEERRVGKECRPGRSSYQVKKDVSVNSASRRASWYGLLDDLSM